VRSPRNSSSSPAPRPRSRLQSAARSVHHAIFHASREGRASEIAGWANAASALAVAAGIVVFTWARLPVHAAWIGVFAGLVTFVGLRLSLAHRFTLWIAAAFGTLTVAALGGALAWLFGHLVESPAAPSIAAVLGAVAAALIPAWGYAHLARRRAANVRDSLIEPISVPGSR
jgi:hypothetical protein